MLSIVTRWRLFTRSCAILTAAAAGLASLCASLPASAQVGSGNYASIVIDAASGNVLSAANPDEFRFPASLTKMMTLYMLFEALRDRRVSLNQYVPVSPSAASMSPTKLGLVPGSLITVEQAILGLVTKSANDAAAALGEMLGGDEDRFAQMMTLRARGLGMTRTTFQNASGLPDWNQVTTARDMANLARHLIQDFPGYYHYFSTPSFVYAGRVVFNHQRLLQTYPGADGLKTGYIDASGFNVVTSAVRADTRLIGVVMGASSGGERDRNMTNLLDQGFDHMGVAPMYLARREAPVREPTLRFPSFIGSAHAASAPVSITRAQPALRQRARASRTAERPEPVRIYPRRGSEGRSEARVMQVLRPTSQARIREPMVRTRPTSNTRTAHQNPGRYPG